MPNHGYQAKSNFTFDCSENWVVYVPSLEAKFRLFMSAFPVITVVLSK